MKNSIFPTIDNKNDYLTALEAVAGMKTDYTDEEKTKLLAIYQNNAGLKFGVTDEVLVKAIMILDTAPDKTAPETSPLAGELGSADLSALTALAALCGDWEGKPTLALCAKSAALDKAVSEPLAFAAARAALDALAGLKDITLYREDIKPLAAFLGQADEDKFTGASTFLIRVRERMR